MQNSANPHPILPLDFQKPQAEDLSNRIARAAALLPMPGPITAFAFLNTIQSLESLPFEEGMKKGARLYNCKPFLTKDQYREKLLRGRILVEDLSSVLIDHLGDGADALIGALGTRFGLRLAMLQYPLRFGPPAELRWFVAESDGLTRFRDDVSSAVRERIVEETRYWVMHDLLGRGANPDDRFSNEGAELTAQLREHVIRRFGESSIEGWSNEAWEAVSLQALWNVCRRGVQGVGPYASTAKVLVRHRDLLYEACREDIDILVNDLLIRFCAAFTDQGFARWPLPNRDNGFFRAFGELYRTDCEPPGHWTKGLSKELIRLQTLGIGPLESIQESLELLGLVQEEWDELIPATLLALRGWAGMIWHMESRPDRVPVPVPPGTLAEFLAVRLILERFALAHVARRKLDYTGALCELRSTICGRGMKQQSPSVEQRAFLVFQLAQILGWSPPVLSRLSPKEWSLLVNEIEAFPSLERRWMFQLAFERRFRIRALDALSIHSRHKPAPIRSPRFQAVFCLDAREESFRRHLEEVAPEIETFGTAGFFGVAMYYRSATDANFTALCPIVVRPKHWLVEDVVYTLGETHQRLAKTRRALGTASRQIHVGSRNIAGGAFLSACLGVLASIPLVARVLFPRLAARVRKIAGRFVEPPPITRLRLERSAPLPGPIEDQIGYSIEEMANVGERVLREIGLTSDFARLVLLLGHGSFCLNNPHKAAYDCGACSGSPGGPNSRALAAILNDFRVREILAHHGLKVPADTIFIGGLHNTAVDSITFSDLDLLPNSHIPDFEAARKTLDEVCQRNAHERCRRFYSAPLNLSLEAAHQHVENRSEDLAQTRPEFGNASNAMCFVGRRQQTRGLYLDRRCFLSSYDPTQDDADHSILARILAAVVPVCEGINMQYYLSYVDSSGWACGTKLPHNVTSLLGVMDGAASDLRPGLPWQGVEIHEPVRLLFVIETTRQAILSIMDRDEVVGRILRNGWAQLAIQNPESREIHVYRNGEFSLYEPETKVLPKAGCSIDWYRGWREHLGFATIESADEPAKIEKELCSNKN